MRVCTVDREGDIGVWNMGLHDRRARTLGWSYSSV